ncbi:MAG: Ig-like domain-containing protein, partial [Casimicrobium sp.]
MLPPSFIDAAGTTAQAQIVGLDRTAAGLATNQYLATTYVRDNQIMLGSGICGSRGYWDYGSCRNPEYESLLQFYREAVGATTRDAEQRFTRSLDTFARFPTFGEAGANVSVVPWNNGARGWMQAYMKGDVRVGGYKAFAVDNGASTAYRFQALAPTVIVPPSLGIVWPGATTQLTMAFIDYDDTRVPDASAIQWFANGSAISAATTCDVAMEPRKTLPYTLVPHEHKIVCNAAWPTPAAGDYAISVSVTDRQGLSASQALGTLGVRAWSASILSPANNDVFLANATATITASVSNTSPSSSTIELLENSVVVATQNSADGNVSFSRSRPAGTYTYQIRATSPNGGVALSQTISLQFVAGSPPTASFTGPASGVEFIAPASVPLSISATSSNGAIVQAIYRSSGSEIGRSTSAPFSFTWNNVPAGDYSVTVEVKDAIGLTATASTPKVFKVYAVAA